MSLYQKLREFHGNHRRWFVILAITSLVAVYLPVRFALEALDRQLTKPSLFSFTLPESAEKSGTSISPDAGSRKPTLPERVYLSGRFSDWALSTEHYRMLFDGTNSWKLELELEPGRHPYRFVLHYPPAAPWWTNSITFAEDPAASSSEMFDDGSRRSVHIVRSVRALREIINFVFLALLSGMLLFSFLRQALHKLMYLRLSLRTKLIISFIFFLIASNIFFIRLTTIQRAEFARYMQIDLINTVHTMLLSEGITFEAIEQRWDMQYHVRERLERFFRFSRLREDYNTYANNKLQLTRVAILDPAGNLIINTTSESLLSFLKSRFQDQRSLTSYFSSLTSRSFAAYQKSPMFGKGTFSFPIFEYFTDDMKEASGEDNIRRYRQATTFFEDNGYITPILQHNRLCGFYFYEVNGKSYSTLFQNALFYNLLLLAVIALLYYFLMKRTTSIMLGPMLALIEGIRMVDKGRFDYNIEVNTHDEIEALGKAYNYMRAEIEHYTKHLESEIDKRARELKRANAVYKEDLYLARQLQQQMLLSEKPGKLHGIEVDVSYNALGEVGGDFYSIFEPRKACVRVFLADATGHGVPAALVTMLIKSEYEKVKMLDDPVDILQIINESFVSTYGDLNVFFTGIIIDIDTARYNLKYVSAGHPVQYLVRQKKCHRLAGRGRIIGVLSNPEFSVESLELEDNDRLILFTDGILEQINVAGTEYGEERLINILENLAEDSDSVAVNAILLDDLTTFRSTEELVDDTTIISIRCTDKPGLSEKRDKRTTSKGNT